MEQQALRQICAVYDPSANEQDFCQLLGITRRALGAATMENHAPWQVARTADLDLKKIAATEKKFASALGKSKLPAILVNIRPGSGWEFNFFAGGRKRLDFWHPFELQDYLDPDDASELAIEKYWEDHDLDQVAGVNRSEKSLAFLWDRQEEQRLKAENQQAKKDNVVAAGIVRDLESSGFALPEAVRAKCLSQKQPHLVFKSFFDWQKKALTDEFKQAKIKFKPAELRAVFNPDLWTDEDYELTGSLHKLFDAIGLTGILNEPMVRERDNPESTPADSTVPAKAAYWGRPKDWRTRAAENAYTATGQLKLEPFVTPLSIPLTQIDLLCQVPMTIRPASEVLMGIQLPDDQAVDEDRIGGAQVLTDGFQSYLQPIDRILREDEVATDEIPKIKAKGRISLHDYLATLPNDTKLDIRIHCEESDLATQRFAGTVKNRKFRIEQRRAGIESADLKKAIKLFRSTNCHTSMELKSVAQIEQLQAIAKTNRDLKDYAKPGFDGKTMTWDSVGGFYATSAIFRVIMAGSSLDPSAAHQQAEAEAEKFWNDLEKLDEELAAGHTEDDVGELLLRKGKVKIHSISLKHLPSHLTAKGPKKQYLDDARKSLVKLGFQHVGNMTCDKLGTTIILCFAGPENMHAHILVGFGIVSEFWTRFENDDVLTTNIMGFANESQPRKGLYYRNYSDRSLSELLEKHHDGIEKLVRQKKTNPIEHLDSMEHFADQLHSFLKRA